MTGETTGVDATLAAALQRFAAAPRVLVALDFDGVLAPIADRPTAARGLPASMEALARLGSCEGVTVSLVTGRALSDLQVVAEPPAGTVVIASHGAEVEGAETPDVPHDVLEQVVTGLQGVVDSHPGTALEHKPAAAVLHTRQASREVAASATEAALHAVHDVEGAHVMQGKEVVEVSVVRADKGTALAALAECLAVDAVLYAGDDRTDEDAFTAVAARGVDADVTIKVGVGDTAATHRIGAPEDVTEVLTRLLEHRA